MTVSCMLRAKDAAAVRIAAGVANGECRKSARPVDVRRSHFPPMRGRVSDREAVRNGHLEGSVPQVFDPQFLPQPGEVVSRHGIGATAGRSHLA